MKKINSPFMRKDKRGLFIEYFNNREAWKSINGGLMKKDAILGNHYHKKCRVFFFIVSGTAQVYFKNIKNPSNKNIKQFILKAPAGCIFDPYETHAIKFLSKSSFLLLKTKKFSKKNKDMYNFPVI